MTTYYNSGLVLGGAENRVTVNSKTAADLVDGGHPDVTHQDKDGSRNDIGPSGGRNYFDQWNHHRWPHPDQLHRRSTRGTHRRHRHH